MPNGSAGPDFSDQVATKKVHAKEMMARTTTAVTKQSPDIAVYDSNNCQKLVRLLASDPRVRIFALT